MKALVKYAFFAMAMISLATACQSKKTEENAATADSTTVMSDSASTMTTDSTMASDSAATAPADSAK